MSQGNIQTQTVGTDKLKKELIQTQWVHRRWYCQVASLLLVTPSPTLKQWARWKDPGPLLFPAFSFLPIRMKAEFFTAFPFPPLLTGPEYAAPQGKKTKKKTVQLRCYGARLCTRTTPKPGRGKGCQGMVPSVQSGWMRVLREAGWRGGGSQALGEQNCPFSRVVDLNVPSLFATAAS